MSDLSIQGKGIEMKPLISGMMAIMMVAIIAQLVQAAPPKPETANLNGYVRDSGTGNPISGGNVALDVSSTSTVDGYYSFSGLTPGAYTLTVTKTGYLTKSITVVLVAGDNTQDIALIPFTDVQLAQLSGTVKNYATGAPLNGVKVTLDSSQTITGALGIYMFSDKTPRSYTMVVSKDGFITQTRTISLVVGDNTQDILLVPEGVPAPEFVVSNLTIVPSTVNLGEPVEISATVRNIGDAVGDYTVTCNISPGTFTQLAFLPAVMPWEDLIDLMVVMMIMGMAMSMMKKPK